MLDSAQICSLVDLEDGPLFDLGSGALSRYGSSYPGL